MHTFITNRKKKLLNLVENGSLIILHSGLLIKKSADAYYDFCVNKNFFYLTNLDEENLIYLLFKESNKSFKEFLFINQNDENKVKWVGFKLTKEEASFNSGVDINNIFYSTEFPTFINSVFVQDRRSKINNVSCVYFDANNDNRTIENMLCKFIFDKADIYFHLANLRRFKDDFEINQIKHAIEITRIGFNSIFKSLKNAKYEKDLEAVFTKTIIEENAKLAFEPIIASDINATILHYVTNSSVLNSNSLILLDLGAQYKQYNADITRTYPKNGKFTLRQKQLYEIVLHVNKEVIKFVKPGISYDEFLNYGKNLLIEECLKIGLIKDPQEISRYYYHGVGHYLGLDVHDVGSYLEPLKEGMVITVEPGLYVKEENIGIRIEDNILITKDGSINLSNKIPKEIKDLEF